MKRVLIKAGWLVTMDPAIGNIRNGLILVSDDKIEAVGGDIAVEADEVIDASDLIVMPGLVNAHMHTWQAGLRGLGADWMFADYFRIIHGNLAKRYRPEDNYIGNLMGAVAQIDAGVTTRSIGVITSHRWNMPNLLLTVCRTVAFAPSLRMAPLCRRVSPADIRSPKHRIPGNASTLFAKAV